MQALRRNVVGALWAGVVFLAGCGNGAGSDICGREGAPAACGQACSASSPCPAQFHCESGSCTSECELDSDCRAGIGCSEDGRCPR